MKLIKLSMVMTALLAAACSVDGSAGSDGTNGKDGKAGENGKDGETVSLSPEESLSLVTPGKGILDREVDVQIGGSATKFDENAQLDFGDGVEVVSVTKSSPTLITARLKISKTAKVGARTVKIGNLEAKDAFKVLAAIEIDGGKVQQGGLVQFDIKNNDEKAFDPNAFALEGAGLIDLGSSASGPFAATGFMLAAPLAKSGKAQLTVSNMGPDGKPKTTFLSASDALEVTARSPFVFDLGTPKEETFGGLDTKLFKLTTAANAAAFVDYRIQVDADGTAIPVAFVFGTNGGVDDRIGQVLPGQNPFTGEFDPAPYDLHVALPVIAGSSTLDHYVVLADLSGTSGAKATITATKVAALTETESSAAHGPDAPQALGAISTSAARILTAELATATEQDVYELAVGASDKIQLTAQSDADLEIVLTKDPNVLEDAQGTPANQRKVLGYFYPGKMSAQRVITNPGTDTIYAVVQSDVQGTVATGKYTLGARKLQ